MIQIIDNILINNCICPKGFSALDVDENGYLTRDEVNEVPVEIFEQHIEAPPGEINTYGASGKTEDDDDEPMNLSHNEL